MKCSPEAEGANIIVRIADAWQGYVRQYEPWYVKMFYKAGRNMPRLVRRRTLSLLRQQLEDYQKQDRWHQQQREERPLYETVSLDTVMATLRKGELSEH